MNTELSALANESSLPGHIREIFLKIRTMFPAGVQDLLSDILNKQDLEEQAVLDEVERISTLISVVPQGVIVQV